MKNDDLLDQCQAEACAVALHREEGLKHALAKRRGHSGAVVGDANPRHLRRVVELRLDHDLRRSLASGARLERISQQVAHRLPTNVSGSSALAMTTTPCSVTWKPRRRSFSRS